VDLAETLEKQLNSSISQGASYLQVDAGRCELQTSLLDQVKPGMQAFDEETFGPLAAL
jgi:succinate-semialdehyde dehydrogenase/glutarate-semialdehyde dehydrogenase